VIFLGWLDSIDSRIIYELDHRKPILYVIPVESILGKLPVVPVGDTGTILHRPRNDFSGAPGDRRPVPAMDAGCGLSIRGYWDGPVICNEEGQAFRASVVRHGENLYPCHYCNYRILLRLLYYKSYNQLQ
jgi:hypothetical protein